MQLESVHMSKAKEYTVQSIISVDKLHMSYIASVSHKGSKDMQGANRVNYMQLQKASHSHALRDHVCKPNKRSYLSRGTANYEFRINMPRGLTAIEQPRCSHN